MPDPEGTPKSRMPPTDEKLVERIASRQARMIRTRTRSNRSFWRPMALIGVIGWTVAIPMLIGIAAGTWIDHRWPSPFSWTLMLLFAGLALGCLLAWTRIKREQEDR